MGVTHYVTLDKHVMQLIIPNLQVPRSPAFHRCLQCLMLCTKFLNINSKFIFLFHFLVIWKFTLYFFISFFFFFFFFGVVSNEKRSKYIYINWSQIQSVQKYLNSSAFAISKCDFSNANYPFQRPKDHRRLTLNLHIYIAGLG